MAALILALFTEWQFRPFVADPKLSYFVRHLTDLTPEHLKEMEALNPKTPSEIEEERQDREFLEGKGADEPPATPSHPHQHKEQP